jgi:hypothetical protein
MSVDLIDRDFIMDSEKFPLLIVNCVFYLIKMRKKINIAKIIFYKASNIKVLIKNCVI